MREKVIKLMNKNKQHSGLKMSSVKPALFISEAVGNKLKKRRTQE